MAARASTKPGLIPPVEVPSSDWRRRRWGVGRRRAGSVARRPEGPPPPAAPRPGRPVRRMGPFTETGPKARPPNIEIENRRRPGPAGTVLVWSVVAAPTKAAASPDAGEGGTARGRRDPRAARSRARHREQAAGGEQGRQRSPTPPPHRAEDGGGDREGADGDADLGATAAGLTSSICLGRTGARIPVR